MSEFTVGDRDFLLDGRPVRLLSGALHYFRVHEAQWGHRLAMLRAMGLNCVETYVPWNLHEPAPGDFRDVAALGRFLDAARGGGPVGDRAPGAVHLRGVGERRAAALADGRAGATRAYP
ncbi:beta-galactosidase [Streptomyces sp. L7]